MGFGDPTASMQASLRQNRGSLKAGKRELFDKKNTSGAKSRKWTDPVQLSEEEQDALHERIRQESRYQRKKEVIFWGVAGVVAATGLVVIWLSIS